MQIIPFKQPGAWEAQITLSGQIFILRFKWNALNEYWVMNIYNRNDLPILLGVKVVVNWNLTGQYAIVGMPPGDIVCQNILGLIQVFEVDGSIGYVPSYESYQPIRRFDMGDVAELFYYEESELETMT